MRDVCTGCGDAYGLDVPRWRRRWGKPLDLTSPPVSLVDIDQARSGVWRYAALLPAVPEEAKVSLGEQTTPLARTDLGARPKLDYHLPSGSYKDRGAAVAVSRLATLGVRDIVLDSSGNAGAAYSTYCAAAGITCRIFTPAGNSPAKHAQITAGGGRLEPAAGPRQEATKAAMAVADQTYYAGHNWSADFIAGLATAAFELWEQLGGKAPSSVLAPCGHGGVVLGLHRGFDALLRGGLIDTLPRLIAVQSAAYDSVVDAIESGLDEPRRRWAGQATLAEGIACELPRRGRQVRHAIRRGSGTAIAVGEAEIADAALRLAGNGYYAEPTAAVAFAGLSRLREQNTDVPLARLPWSW